MKELRKSELANIQGGFNKSFWNGFCDASIFVGFALYWAPNGGQLGGSLILSGVAVAGCLSGPEK